MKFITDWTRGILGSPDNVTVWDEITSHIPDDILLKDNVKILSVACGHATEADVIVKRMQELGIPNSKILNSIYLIDKYHVFTNRAKRRGYFNVITADFLQWNTDLKFDVIVSNPPYNSGGQKQVGIYPKFVEKMRELLTPTGHIGLILPTAWLISPSYRRMRETILREFSLDYLKMHGMNVFDGHVETCSINLSPGITTEFMMISPDNQSFIMSPLNGIIPKVHNDDEYQILKKVAAVTGIDMRRGKQTTVRHNDEKIFTPWLTETETATCYHVMLSRLLGGEHEIYYTSEINDPHFNSYRVVFSYISSFTSGIGYVTAVDPGIQLSTSLSYIVCNDRAEAEDYVVYLKSKFFKFMTKKYKTSPSWSGFIGTLLPEMNSITLSADEINYIDANY